MPLLRLTTRHSRVATLVHPNWHLLQREYHLGGTARIFLQPAQKKCPSVKVPLGTEAMSETTIVTAPGSEVGSEGSPTRMRYLGLALTVSFVAFLGFSFTYFRPALAGEYPPVSPTVHVHGWTFFLWYLLLPLQAWLVSRRNIALHRSLGAASVVLAIAMTLTGLVVIGHQMELAQGPDGSPFWRLLGPAIFVTLLLFVVFYALALKHRRNRDLHKRFMLLASTGALGAAAFRVLGQIIGMGAPAGIGGILAPNLIIVAAIMLEVRRGGGIHPVYLWGLPASIAVEGGVILLTPTPVGQALASGLAWLGAVSAPLY